jgi:hypothetical protein
VANHDAFALRNLGLDEFLFAEVGTEANGSALTILSTLARLDQDPWAEAARWAQLPKAAGIDCLAQCISRMPLGRQALANAVATASRLILLLPTQTGPPPQQDACLALGRWTIPRWAPIAFFYAGLACVLAASTIFAPIPTAGVTAPIGQTAGQTQK